MGMVVRTNMAAINANNSLQQASKAQQSGMQKLASGFKINKAADDASGLSISEKMKNQIKALDAAKDNCEDGANLIQTTEGYMNETHDMLNRMVELSEKAANGVLENEDRDALQNEMDELCAEIDRMATTANFNGRKLLDGSIGSNGTVKITSDASGSHYSVSDKAPEKKLMTATTPTLTNTSVAELSGSAKDELTAKITAAAEAQAYSSGKAGTIKVAVNKNGDIFVDGQKETEITANVGEDVTAAIKTSLQNIGFAGADDLDTTTGNKGVTQEMIDAVKAYNETQSTAATDAEAKDKFNATTNKNGYSLISVTVAKTTVEAAEVNEGIKLQIGESSTAADKMEVTVGSFHTDTLLGGINGFTNRSASTTGETDASAVASTKANKNATYSDGITIDISDQNKASAAADALRQVSNYVSDQRGKLGAQQNRLDHTVNNLTTASENVSAANSRIRDTDMAKEMMAYTSKNVIAQAAQSMLAQANSQPQNVLSLLQ
ncbi:MAG: flagellin [Oscillospiraceae bacterium]|nr:flagellin [Oscillospiraceae bacterium]